MTATTTAPAKTAKMLKACRCSTFEVGEFDAEKDGVEFGTECSRQTNRLFAQGHDAKLVSFLVNGELDGYEIRTAQGGVAITFPGAVAAASSVSEALGVKAAAMLANRKAKAEAKATRQAERAAKKTQAANPTPEPVIVKAKVGRWSVEGTVDAEGRLAYTSKKGEAKTAEAGKWSPVA